MSYGLKISLVRGRTRRLASSLGLGWKSFGVEHHLVPRGPKEETLTNIHVITPELPPRLSASRR
jgi:hypothetical protein